MKSLTKQWENNVEYVQHLHILENYKSLIQR